MLAKPRQMTSATSLVGVCADAETGTPAQSGSGRDHTAMPGTMPRFKEASATVASTMPAAAIEVAERPLEPGDGRRSGAEHGADGRRLGGVRLRRPVAVRDDHADVRGAEARIVQRLPDRAHHAVAVVADRDQPLRLACVAAAQVFAHDGRSARRG